MKFKSKLLLEPINAEGIAENDKRLIVTGDNFLKYAGSTSYGHIFRSLTSEIITDKIEFNNLFHPKVVNLNDKVEYYFHKEDYYKLKINIENGLECTSYVNYDVYPFEKEFISPWMELINIGDKIFHNYVQKWFEVKDVDRDKWTITTVDDLYNINFKSADIRLFKTEYQVRIEKLKELTL